MNLDDVPGKVVGKVKRRSPEEAVAWLVRQARALGVGRLPYPKGVHRFKTLDEANEWQMKHLIAGAVKRLRAHQR